MSATPSPSIQIWPGVPAACHSALAAGDTQGAVADIQATLQHEPRSFAAFETLAEISMARNDWKGAYESWQKVMELDPKTPGGERIA